MTTATLRCDCGFFAVRTSHGVPVCGTCYVIGGNTKEVLMRFNYTVHVGHAQSAPFKTLDSSSVEQMQHDLMGRIKHPSFGPSDLLWTWQQDSLSEWTGMAWISGSDAPAFTVLVNRVKESS